MPTRPHRRRERDLQPVPPPPALNPSQTHRTDPAGPERSLVPPSRIGLDRPTLTLVSGRPPVEPA
jgi:hypothetical protein